MLNTHRRNREEGFTLKELLLSTAAVAVTAVVAVPLLLAQQASAGPTSAAAAESTVVTVQAAPGATQADIKAQVFAAYVRAQNSRNTTFYEKLGTGSMEPNQWVGIAAYRVSSDAQHPAGFQAFGQTGNWWYGCDTGNRAFGVEECYEHTY